MHKAWLRLDAALAAGAQINEPLSYLYRLLHNLVLDWRRGEIRARRRDESWTDATGSARPGISDEPAAERILVARGECSARSRAEPMPKRRLLPRLSFAVAVVIGGKVPTQFLPSRWLAAGAGDTHT